MVKKYYIKILLLLSLVIIIYIELLYKNDIPETECVFTGAQTDENGNLIGKLRIKTTPKSLEGKMYRNFRNCSTLVRNGPKYVQRNSFWVLENYIPAAEKFPCDETITYTTHGEYFFLDNLIFLTSRWKGPISVAVYAPGSDFKKALEKISYLRNCERNDIKKYVTFHLFFDLDHIPKTIPNQSDIHNFDVQCHNLPKYFNSPKDVTYRKGWHLLYPVNVARNIARLNAETYFILASDIELYPSPNVIPEFMKMLRRPDISTTTNKRVYVLPVFEVKEKQKPPETKSELLSMLRQRTAVVFHQKICNICHIIPEFREWRREKSAKGLSVHSIGKRYSDHNSWEPFYIGTNEEPLFDERLTSEGRANKMTQAYSMCLLDYEYHVLDNAFLVHKPGIKQGRKEILMNELVARQNDLIFDVIVKEYQLIYGTNSRCQVAGRPKNVY